MSDEPEDLYVHGRRANIPEFLISQAWDILKIDYEFQKILWGGRELRGGVLIDWLLHLPRPLPVEYFGEHWHSGTLGADDRFRLQRIAQYYGVPEVVVIWGNEVDGDTPIEEVVQICRDKIGANL